MNLPTRIDLLVASLALAFAATTSVARADAFDPEGDPSIVRSGTFPSFAASLATDVQIEAVRTIDVDGDGDFDRVIDVVSSGLGEGACVLARRSSTGWSSVVLDRGAIGEYLDVRCGEPVRAAGRVFLTTSGYGRELDVEPYVTYNRYQVITADRDGGLWLVHDGITRNALETWQLRADRRGGLVLVEQREREIRGGLAVMRSVRNRSIRWDPTTRVSTLSRWVRGAPRATE